MPERLRYEWQQILSAHGGNEAVRILESTKNRLKPFFDSGILRRMFGSVVNRFNALQFMKEGKIVILDLSSQGRLSPQEANAIAGLVMNEFLAAARSLPRHERYPTYLWLDEFQRLVSPDLEYSIPEVRQLGIRLILAHQSFSQLVTDDTDLTSLIWQPATRIAFAEQGEDAELLAKEFALSSQASQSIVDVWDRFFVLQTSFLQCERSAMITERDIQSVLLPVVRYYVLNRQQIQRIGFADDANGRSTRRRIQAVVDAGFITRHTLFPFSPAHGAPAPVYYPT